MKAPNKIKIVRFTDTAELSDYWVLDNRTKNDDIEYIRKDALLELLKGYNHPVTQLVIQEITDKINSM